MKHRHNIVYTSKQIADFYGNNRRKWDDFYPSERWVFERIAGEKEGLGDVLDVGCACGGLGLALQDRVPLRSYSGIDINADAIAEARNKSKLLVPSLFIAGDILQADIQGEYDTVVSLSCADWNIETAAIIKACWDRVKTGGYFVISLRLTTGQGVNDIQRSYQQINFSGKDQTPEIANYVVFNFKEALGIMHALTPAPALIGAYGYLGSPSSTAVTPFDAIVFAVFYVKKSANNSAHICAELNFPLELFV